MEFFFLINQYFRPTNSLLLFKLGQFLRKRNLLHVRNNNSNAYLSFSAKKKKKLFLKINCLIYNSNCWQK